MRKRQLFIKKRQYINISMAKFFELIFFQLPFPFPTYRLLFTKVPRPVNKEGLLLPILMRQQLFCRK